MQRVFLVILYFCSFLAMAQDTVLKLYRPFGEVVEQISPVAKRKMPGQCMGQSQLIVREDAWRCQAEGKLFDPCFVKAGSKATEVLCPQSPWSDEGIQLEMNASLNNESHSVLDMSRVFPWAVELTNGEHCQAIESQEQYDSMPVRYQCTNHNILVGYLQRCKPVWSMLEKTAHGVITVDLAKAWF
jgi:hypothetical protein